MKRICDIKKPKNKQQEEKSQEIAWLMTEFNVDHAIRLQLDKIIEDHKQWLSDNNTGKRANLIYAKLRGANLRGADLRYANLRYANLRGANLSDSNLCGADLRYANLSDANLSDANLSGANLSDANLRYADLRYADLRGADLSCSNLSGANLSDANLSGANLSYAKLRSANLRDADIRGANLSGADLRYSVGISVNYKNKIKCEFQCGLSIEANIIYIGCKQHTILEWQSYIDSGLNLYLSECSSIESHDQCVEVIKELIEISETRKQ